MANTTHCLSRRLIAYPFINVIKQLRNPKYTYSRQVLLHFQCDVRAIESVLPLWYYQCNLGICET